MNYPCSGLIAFGNNLRTIPTDISNTEQLEGTDFAVFPNPVKDKATVKILLQENQNTSIELKNTLGQVLKTIDFKATSSDFFTQEIDFNALDLVNGVYFVSANINGSIHTQKIVYNK